MQKQEIKYQENNIKNALNIKKIMNWILIHQFVIFDSFIVLLKTFIFFIFNIFFSDKDNNFKIVLITIMIRVE